MDGFYHKALPRDYFHGVFPGSWARGILFQENLQSGDARTSGRIDCIHGGIDADPGSAVRRLVLLSIVYSYGGIPPDLHGRRDRPPQR